MNYIYDMTRALSELSKFVAYVRWQNNGAGRISFRDINGYLGREEDFKSSAAEKARKELRVAEWSTQETEVKKITMQAIEAMKKGFQHLVNSHQKDLFVQQLSADNPKRLSFAAKMIYDVFCGSDPEKAFEEAIEVFGARYDIISFLFFIKNDSAYLPCSSRNMEKGFARLGIEYPLDGKCSWENYYGFLSIMREIRDFLQQYLPDNGEEIRLVDAHSFVWILHHQEFIDWIPEPETVAWIEENTERLLQKPKGPGKDVTVFVPDRSAEVVAAAKKRVNGICELCGEPAPFLDKKGNPYLEAHHIIWLSKGGSDTIDNVAALCPNCHTKMHVVDDEKDVCLLQKRRADTAHL